jgi:hypothetical protein
MNFRSIAAAFLMVVLGALSGASAAPASPTTQPIGANLVTNGSFEQENAYWPFVPNGAQSSGEAVSTDAHSGKSCYKLTNKSGFAPNVFARIDQVVPGLEPYTTYRISCYVKGKNVGIDWIGGGPGWYLRQRFPTGTYDWTYVETLWTTKENGNDFDLMVCTESPTEALYVDDIKMEPIATDAVKRDAAMAKFDALRDGQIQHFKKLDALAHANGSAADPTVRLGLSVSRYFLDRMTQAPVSRGRAWAPFQLQEIDGVLDQTERQIEHFLAHGAAATSQPYPLGKSATVRDGVFHTDTSAGQDQPWFYYGMGHFGQVFKDLPFWHDLGATVVQDGQVGPNGMEQDGTLLAPALQLLADVRRASLYNVKVDYLLSPHYFPDWAWKLPHAEEMHAAAMGFLGFDIDHPIARDAVGRWADIISKRLKGSPALLSICLSNEPVWNASGRTKYSVGEYHDDLKGIHHTIEALNRLYGTKYKSFDEITPPPDALTSDLGKNRAYYDWTRFNKKHFADWHAWMGSIIHKNLPNAPTHAKIMVFFTMDRNRLGWGVDPQLMCEATDLAGCDAYAFPAPDYKTYDWRGEEFWYDLLNSFRNQPVFNSENHIIPDGTGPVHIPPTMTRAQYWQGALHHQGITTTWVWEPDTSAGLGGSIFFRPGNTYGAGRAFLDLGRFANEVAAINAAPARVALLYSQPSIFWSGDYFGDILDLYTRLNFLGQKTTFVSEKQLREGKMRAGIKCIILPQATHVEDATIEGLKTFIASGGKVLAYGKGNLEFDPYHRSRKLPADLKMSEFEFQKDPRSQPEQQEKLRGLLKSAGIEGVALVDSQTGQQAWNVEYRTIDDHGTTLIPVINFAADAVMMKFPSLAGRKAIDLLSRDSIDLDHLKLAPMVPLLIRLDKQSQ